MLGSGAATPVSGCDIAGPLRLHSNAIDRIPIAEGATKLEDELMIISDQIRTDIPSRCVTRYHIFNWPQFPNVGLVEKIAADDLTSTDSLKPLRCLLLRMKAETDISVIQKHGPRHPASMHVDLRRQVSGVDGERKTSLPRNPPSPG
jgi:hypothetical protein